MLGAVCAGHAARLARRLPGAAWGRPPADALGDQLPRQHLRAQGPRGHPHHLCERGRQPERGARPLDLVFPDQFLDRTFNRVGTFFGQGLVAHVAFSHPVCERLRGVAAGAAEDAGARVLRGGTYVCMEGPQFSTLAESKLYRSWGMDVIGMTNLQEAKLAREAEICYATMALVTDYDCWHPDHDAVTVDMVLANLQQNARTAQHVIAETVARLGTERPCGCKDALAAALITRPDAVPARLKRDLAPIVGRYLPVTD
ncbi:MAG: hypothetical protein R2708_11165 [Vicinamibacterales bacterium]